MQNLHRSAVECIPKQGAQTEVSRVILMHFCKFSPEIANIPTIFSGEYVKSFEISFETDVAMALLDLEI